MNLFDQKWAEFCAQCLVQSNPKDFIRWRLENLQFFESGKEGIAILTSLQEVVWASRQFQNWFPKVNDPILGLSIMAVLDGVRIHYDETQQLKYANPFAEFQATGKPAKSVIQTKNGTFFELSVHPWTLQGCSEQFMLLHVQDITTHWELMNKLANLHEICVQVSHIHVLNEQNRETREQILNDEIRYMAQNQMHYEFLEVRKYDPIGKTLPLYTHYGILNEAEQRTIQPLPTENGTIGFVAYEKKSYICHDTRNDPHYLLGGETALSSLTVPIIFQGELLGVLNAESSQLDAFKEIDLFYAEIFAHEIAQAMHYIRSDYTDPNLESAAPKQKHKISLEEIHGTIALPIWSIRNLLAKLGEVLKDDQIVAQHALYQIIEKTEVIAEIVQKVGEQLTPIDSAPPDRKEIVEQWYFEYFNKRILLIDSNEKVYNECVELFNCLSCSVDWVKTGKEGLQVMGEEMDNGTPYWAILVNKMPEDYEKATQFFIDLAKVYGRTHPPLIVLESTDWAYDKEHTTVNIKKRYPATERVGTPFNERHLLSTVHKAVTNSKVTEPDFTALGEKDTYDDPYAIEKKKE